LSCESNAEGVNDVAYETKVLLIAIAQITAKASGTEEVYNAVAKMANAEGVVLEPYDEAVKNVSKRDD
jgi:hypothetical protein